MRISDWSSDVCSSDLVERVTAEPFFVGAHHARGRFGQAFARWMVAGPADQRAHGGFGFPAAGARVFGCGIALQWRGFDGGLAFFEHGVPLHGEYPSDAPAVARFPRAEREPGDACVIQSGVRCKPSPQERPMGAACFQARSEEHTSELQSLMRLSYAVFCLKKKKKT